MMNLAVVCKQFFSPPSLSHQLATSVIFHLSSKSSVGCKFPKGLLERVHTCSRLNGSFVG